MTFCPRPLDALLAHVGGYQYITKALERVNEIAEVSIMFEKCRLRSGNGPIHESAESLSGALCPMSRDITLRAVILGAMVSLMLFPQGIWAQEDTPESISLFVSWEIAGVTPRAKRILSDMSKYLASAEEFTFSSDVVYDSLLWNGQKIQFGGVADVAVRRPDRLHVEYRGDERETQVVFDGQKFTILNILANVYTSTEGPSEIDTAIDHMIDDYGVSVPIADLVYSDPYATFMENVESGFFIGRHKVSGIACDHLAFAQETIDWQIWIEAGPRPVPRKLLITYKDQPGSPQYVATFSDWNFQPRLSDHYFKFRPPDGADEIEFLRPELDRMED